MKKTLLILSALAFTLTACAGEPNALVLDQYNATGNATKKVVVPVSANGILSTNAASAPVFTPKSDFLTAGILISASAALDAKITAKENAGAAASLITSHTAAANPHTQYALASALTGKQDASSALAKVTEKDGLPMWSGSAWPGGPGGAGSGLPLLGNEVNITNPSEYVLTLSTSDDLSARINLLSGGEIHLKSYEMVYVEAGGNNIELISKGGDIHLRTNYPVTVRTPDDSRFMEVRAADGATDDSLVTKRQLAAAVASAGGASSGQTIVTIPRIGNTFTLDANADVCIINQPESDYEYMHVAIPSNRKQGALVLIINNTDYDTGVYHFQQSPSPWGYRGHVQNAGGALASGDGEFTLNVAYGARLDFLWHGNVMSVTGCVFQ